jgi:hypothetical protein
VSTAQYVGNTAPADDRDPLEPGFYNDIPARDLTADDWNALTADQQALVSSSSLYVVTP